MHALNAFFVLILSEFFCTTPVQLFHFEGAVKSRLSGSFVFHQSKNGAFAGYKSKIIYQLIACLVTGAKLPEIYTFIFY